MPPPPPFLWGDLNAHLGLMLPKQYVIVMKSKGRFLGYINITSHTHTYWAILTPSGPYSHLLGHTHTYYKML